MYEEDRVQAMSMYSSLFDETDDETGLLQLLVSPTRQAVNLARAYDASERKLQAHSQARDAGAVAEEEPAFIQVIDRLREQAAAKGAISPKVSDDQFSLFEDAELDTSVFDDVAATLDEQPAEAVSEHAAPGADRYPDEDAAPDDSQALPVQAAPAEPEDTLGPEPADDAVEAFLAGFNIEGNELAGTEEPPAAEEPPLSPVGDAPAAPAAREISAEGAPALSPAPLEPLPDLPAEPFSAEVPAEAVPRQTVRKTRTFLLILFILFAVPITLVCILILLLPTLLCLSLAFSGIMLGISGLTAAFTSFSVIADILLILGCALVVLALGILLAWTFIWFVFGAIPGLVRGVISLGRRLCTKEVEVS